MNYKQAVKACEDDLRTRDPAELAKAAEYYGIRYSNKNELYKKLARQFISRHYAQMPPPMSDADKALFDAIQRKDLVAVKALIETGGADLGTQDIDGITALMLASITGDLGIVRTLLATGKAKPDAQDFNKWTALMKAADEGHSDIVNALLATGKANPGAYDDEGWTALMMAASEGELEIVKALLRPDIIKKANPGAPNSEGNTVLMIALDNEHPEVAKALLASGQANPGAQDLGGDSTLIYAIRTGDLQLVNAVLETGEAMPAVQNLHGDTALMAAAQYGNLDIARAILKTGDAGPGAQNNDGNTALLLAALQGYQDIAEAILDTQQGNPGAQNVRGWTALMYAARYGYLELVQALLATGKAQVNAQNNEGQTALKLAGSATERIDRDVEPDLYAKYTQIERILAEATLKRAEKIWALPPPKEAPLWMHLCAKLTGYGMETLRRLAQNLDIDTRDVAGKPKDKRRLCYDLAQNYEELLKIEAAAPAEEYEHKGVVCDNKRTLAGYKWKKIAPEDLFVDEWNYCFSFDDIEGIMQANQLHPLSRIPMAQVKLKDGGSLLAAFDARKETKPVEIEVERLKKMRQVHTLVTNPTQRLMNNLAELIDEGPTPAQRNYFDVGTLKIWQDKDRKDYQQLLATLRTAELVQENRPVLDILTKFITPSFTQLLEMLIQSIKAMPAENKQTYQWLLIGLLEPEEEVEEEEVEPGNDVEEEPGNDTEEETEEELEEEPEEEES